MRYLAAVVCLVLVIACGYGFVASGEPGAGAGWRIGYGGAGLFLAVAALWLLVGRRARGSEPR